MVLQAAVVGEPAALGGVEDVQQLFVAARAAERLGQRQALVVAMLVDQLEQLDDAAWRDLVALEAVEPDALAGEAKVEFDRPVYLAGQR